MMSARLNPFNLYGLVIYQVGDSTHPQMENVKMISTSATIVLWLKHAI